MREDERRGAIEARFAASDRPFAANASAGVSELVDGWSRSYVEQFRDACEKTRAGAQSEHLLDLRMACLEGVRTEMEATLELLESADAELVERAVTAVAEVTDPSRCARVEELTRTVDPPDPAIAEAVTELDLRLARAKALEHAGRMPELATQSAKLLEQAEAIGYLPQIARVAVVLADAQGFLQEHQASIETSRGAIAAALVSGEDEMLAEAMLEECLELTKIVHRDDELIACSSRSRAAVERVGLGTALEARWYQVSGAAHYELGELEQAIAHVRRAVQIIEALELDSELPLASALFNYGEINRLAGHYEEAERALTRAIELREAALGPDHPLVAQALNSLGVAMIFEGDRLGAREALGRVLEIRRATLGPDHDLVGGALNNIAYTYFMGDEWTGAVDYYGRSLEIREQTLGPSSTKVAEILMDRGWSLHGLGRDAEARDDLERSIAIFDARPEENRDENGCQSHARLAVVLDALGDAAAAGLQRAGGCRDENGVDR